MIGMNRFGVIRTAPAEFDGTYPLPAGGGRTAGYKAVESNEEREPVVIENSGLVWVGPPLSDFARRPPMPNPFRPARTTGEKLP